MLVRYRVVLELGRAPWASSYLVYDTVLKHPAVLE